MRNLEDHIGPEELASLPESLEEARQDRDYEDLFLHIDRCPECAELIAVHTSLHQFRPAETDAASCPSEMEWLEYAAAVRPEAAETLLAHASHCQSCAAQLRQALELMQHSAAESLPVGLKSSQPAWQQRIGTKMAKEARRPTEITARSGNSRRWSLFSPWFAIPACALVLLGLVIGSIRVWRMAFPSDSRMLAMAYNQQRTIPLRSPGGDPVPLASETRGPDASTRTPSALTKVKARAEEHLERNENSAYWHQVLGEVNLLERKGIEARHNFESSRMVDPNLPHLQSDLAAASFLIGEENHRAREYADAAEYYSKALLEPHADAGLLYYNRALCWERLNITENALRDLRAALAAEKSSAWRKAIEEEIASLSQKSSVAGLDAHSPPGANGHNPRDGFIDDGYEESLARITEQLLPRWSTDSAVQAQIADTGRSGIRHHDRWLQSWIEAPHGTSSVQGDRSLGAAIAAVASGEIEQSLADSGDAIRGYTAGGNNPGRIRATLARVYALQRLDRFRECLSAAEGLEREPAIGQYAWIRSQLYLEEGSCRLAAGDFDGAGVQISRALNATSSQGLFALYLRAVAGQSQVLQFRGSPVEAWQLNAEALGICRRLACPPVREYLLLYTLVQSAQSLDLTHVALELMRTAESVASVSHDATVHAYATEILAQVAGDAGDFNQSDSSFAAALALADKVPSMQSVRLYRAEWQTDRAETLLRRGQARAAIDLLTNSQQPLLASDYQHGRIRLFARLSAAQLATGQPDSALRNALAAVSEAERTLPTLHSAIEREEWQRENRACYEQLIRVYLHENRPNEASQAWVRSRSLPVAAQLSSIASAGTAAAHRTSPDRAAPILALAAVGDSYVGWLLEANPLHVVRSVPLGDATAIHQLLATFYHLCSDPDSNLRDVRATGERLYSIFLRPFADLIGRGQTLWLDLDPSLASVAFPALWVPGEGWLGESHGVAILPSWWAGQPRINVDSTGLAGAGSAVIVNGFAPHESAYSEAGELAAMFARPILLDGGGSAPAAALDHLVSASVFHFSGHATSESGATRLLFPAGEGARRYVDAADIAPLHLRQCRIAVLAACNTTDSNPDRVEYSPDLRNALLQSGVHAVVASHWDVDDRATAALMKLFYRHLLGGSSATASLMQAEQTLASDPKWQHPYYWASFQLYSD